MDTGDELTRIARLDDDAIDLLDAALALARWSEPALTIEPYRRHAERLVLDAHTFIGDAPPEAASGADATRQILARRYGYGTIHSPRAQADNANLARVIDRRAGNAMTLCLLYAHVLQRLGLKITFLDFSVRPLVRIEDVYGTRRIIDPLNDGRALNARALRHAHQAGATQPLDLLHLPILARRALLVRLQNRITSHGLKQNAPDIAFLALEGALRIAPDDAQLWHEAGLLNLRFNRTERAVSILEQFLRLPGAEPHRYTTSQILQNLYVPKGKPRP